MHGASSGNLVFLPKNAVYVEVSPLWAVLLSDCHEASSAFDLSVLLAENPAAVACCVCCSMQLMPSLGQDSEAPPPNVLPVPAMRPTVGHLGTISICTFVGNG